MSKCTNNNDWLLFFFYNWNEIENYVTIIKWLFASIVCRLQMLIKEAQYNQLNATNELELIRNWVIVSGCRLLPSIR